MAEIAAKAASAALAERHEANEPPVLDVARKFLSHLWPYMAPTDGATAIQVSSEEELARLLETASAAQAKRIAELERDYAQLAEALAATRAEVLEQAAKIVECNPGWSFVGANRAEAIACDIRSLIVAPADTEKSHEF